MLDNYLKFKMAEEIISLVLSLIFIIAIIIYWIKRS